ncbi:MAG: glycosyltransferase family 2 protein [Mariniblastus sp.]
MQFALVVSTEESTSLRAVVVCRKQTTPPATALAGQELHLKQKRSPAHSTSEVVAKYVSLCPNIRLFQRSVNRGVAAARNIGVKLSAGRFITFLDSDDEYAVNHLALRRRILQNNSDIRMLHGGLRIIGNPFVVDKDNPCKTIHLTECEVGGTFVIKRDVFQEIGGFEDLSYAEDSNFFETAIESGIHCQAVNHPSYIYYRNTNGQLTSQQFGKNGQSNSSRVPLAE